MRRVAGFVVRLFAVPVILLFVALERLGYEAERLNEAILDFSDRMREAGF
jgi:hypothetical protein